MKAKIQYETPNFEIILLTSDYQILEGSGDGTVVGPGEEIPS